MKRSPITMITGGILAVIFLCLLFLYQVRETEVAVITRFGKVVGSKDTPGLGVRLPYPIHSIYTFDKRIHSFEKRFEQTTTADARNLLITVFVGWKVDDPRVFLERFRDGDVKRAEQSLENLVRDTKNGVIGQHPFGHLISPNEDDLKFEEIEQEMLSALQPIAKDKYGVEVVLLGIKQLGLPESTTTSVFERMREERQKEVTRFKGEGESQARIIRSEAKGRRDEIVAQAEAEKQGIIAKADEEAAKYYAVFEENPELAILLFELKALQNATGKRTTLILDENTPPFNLLQRGPGGQK